METSKKAGKGKRRLGNSLSLANPLGQPAVKSEEAVLRKEGTFGKNLP
jgi:hypothetical protein